MAGTRKPDAYALVVIGLVSCSMLMYEVLLTRICALRLFFHFGFLIVSNCLLGIGAAGSLIFLKQEKWRDRPRLWIRRFSLVFVVSLVASYAFLIRFPIQPGIKFRTFQGLWTFSVFNLAAAVPFFFAGCVIGLILTFNAEHVNRVYSVDLLGAGAGCLLTPLFLSKSGAGGTLVLLVLLAMAAVVAAAPPPRRPIALAVGAVLGIGGLVILPGVDARFPIPLKDRITVTKDTVIEVNDSTLQLSRWSAISRVDLISLAPGQSTIYGRGDNTRGMPVPEGEFILQDGSAGTLILDFSEHPEGLEVLKKTLYSAAVQLRREPRVFIIGVGGGNDVWAAKAQNAGLVRGIELNQQILDIHRKVLPSFSRAILDDPRIELVFGEGRSALMRESQLYDIIQMTGIDTWTSLTSGAYMLAENYLYTVEAVGNMYDRLDRGGILQITRFAGEMEILRLLANIHAALDARGVGDFQGSVACLYVNSLVAVLVKNGTFTDSELARLEEFSRDAGIQFLYHPKVRQNHSIDAFVRAPDKERFIRDYPRDISPTPDDKPYFFNFTRWTDLPSAWQAIDESIAVSQGNPLFIFGQLGLSAVIAGALILLPLAALRRRGSSRRYRTRFLLYFLGIGTGFIFIEIAVMQKLVLFLGHPLYSITVTLFALLVFTGLGSLLSARWFASPTPRVWIVPLGLAVLLGGVMLFSAGLVNRWIGWPTPMRLLVSTAALAPIGLLLGIPFAYGVRLLDRFNPALIPWAWAVNACATVIGSILTVILSMNFGFNLVLGVSVACYLVTFLAVQGLHDEPCTSGV